jgi:hypothetical protein
VNQPVRPEDVRASDADRELVQQWLHRAHTEGSLDLAEFDARVVLAWQAKTRGELVALTADLPSTAHVPAAPVVPPPPRKPPKALRVLTTIWLSVSAFNFALWLLVSLLADEGFVHPWFLWVALPAGSVLGVIWLTTGSAKRR